MKSPLKLTSFPLKITTNGEIVIQGFGVSSKWSEHSAQNFFKSIHGSNIDENGIPNYGLILISFET